ncbi:DUF72 domain-containing protein [Hamadaea tsunoensis]|uniref:DUF72 domain-containing protein n=1 Tax=Hamadaea tsunoensis TaxID=53368 RepID=UPI0003F98123|nr:DUF72 domain-containing protein [Hamadaea tsunoensis]
MILVGTSGWQYKDWRGPFYPRAVAQRDWLEFYAARFAAVEINNSFYRLPEKKTFADWAARTPDGFVFAPKMSRYLTHVRRLRDPAEPVARFLDRCAALGGHLGPVLLQLPPTLRADDDALDDTLRRFPSGVRVAVEPRHASWFTPSTRAVLERRKAALCWADRLGRPVGPGWRTTEWGYLRMHEGRAEPRPRYGRAALRACLERASEFDGDVFVFFNNDPGAAAIHNAGEFQMMITRRPGRPR